MLKMCDKCDRWYHGCQIECKEWHEEQTRLAHYRAEVWHKKTKRFFLKHKILSSIIASLILLWIIYGTICIVMVISSRF